MVCRNEKGAGGLRPRDIVKGAVHRGAEVTGGTRAVVVAPSGLGAKGTHRVPRAWPWCDETKIMARERRATWGRLTEWVGGWGPEDSRGRGCEGSAAPARGAATHGAYRRPGRGKRLRIALHNASRRARDTSNAVPVAALRVAA